MFAVGLGFSGKLDSPMRGGRTETEAAPEAMPSERRIIEPGTREHRPSTTLRERNESNFLYRSG
jgi:hypothetical protein